MCVGVCGRGRARIQVPPAGKRRVVREWREARVPVPARVAGRRAASAPGVVRRPGPGVVRRPEPGVVRRAGLPSGHGRGVGAARRPAAAGGRGPAAAGVPDPELVPTSARGPPWARAPALVRAAQVRRLARRGCRDRRQQRERVDVGVAASCFAHAEVEVRRCGRALARGSDRAEALASRYVCSGADRDRREVEVRGVEAVAGPHAHRQTGRAGDASEADLPAGRRHHRRSDSRPDVDAPVLTRGIRIGSVPVRRDHLAANGPDPGRFGRRGEHPGDYEEGCEDEQESAHPATVRARRGGGGGGVAGLLRFVTRM